MPARAASRSPPVHSAGSTPSPCRTSLLGRTPSADHRVAFAARLHEHAVGLPQQPAQVRRGVLPAGAVVRVGRVAEVQERREEERHAAPRASRSPQAIGNEYGNAVAWTASSGPSKRPASRHIAGQIGLHGSGQALPAAERDERRGLQDVAAARESAVGV